MEVDRWSIYLLRSTYVVSYFKYKGLTIRVGYDRVNLGRSKDRNNT
jgi:hypothetical protein